MLASMRSRLLEGSVGLLVVAGLAALGCAACDSRAAAPIVDEQPGRPNGSDGGPVGPVGPVPEREIRILSDARVQLEFGDSTTLRVLLRDPKGKAAVAERVSFGLRGRSQDASLAALDALTDDQGEATATLMAGDMAATFEVRVSAAGALDRHVAVAISDSGFGSLEVDAPYAGRRDVRERVIVARADTRCEDLARSAGDPAFTLLGEQVRAEFLALPAATRYAVAGFAQGASGVVLAGACVDGVGIDAGRTTQVTLEWTDAMLVPAAQLRLDLALRTRAPAAWLGAVLESAGEAAVTRDAEGEPAGSDAESRFLLDALDSTLRKDEAETELADALVKARADAGGKLEKSLGSLLVVNDEGPLRSVTELKARTVAALERIDVAAVVGIDDRGAPGDYALSASTMKVSASGSGGDPVASVILSAALPTSMGHATRISDEDALEVDVLRLRVALGALAAKVLGSAAEVTAEDDASSPAALLGCATLEEWLGKQAIAGADACDQGCFDAVCARAMVRVLAAVEPALMAVDDARPELQLSGSLVLEDRDGDLLADSVEVADLVGEWPAAVDGGSGANVSGLGQSTAIVVAE